MENALDPLKSNATSTIYMWPQCCGKMCILEEMFDDNYQSEYGTYYKVGMQYTHDYVLAAQYDTTKAVTIGKEKNPIWH